MGENLFDFFKQHWRSIFLILLFNLVLFAIPDFILVLVAGNNEDLQLLSSLMWALITLPISVNTFGALLDISDGKPFSYEKIIKCQYLSVKKSYEIALLQMLYVVLWMLLFFVPGIIKAISYSLSTFIRIKEPNLSANEAIDKSRSLMSGHKGTFFIQSLIFEIPYFIIMIAPWGLTNTFSFALDTLMYSLLTLGLMLISVVFFKGLYEEK